jgi:hypothetical protein
MSAPYRTERDRGIKEYREQLAELRKKWPVAFPVHDQAVRPLAVDATYEIAAVMGWSYQPLENGAGVLLGGALPSPTHRS